MVLLLEAAAIILVFVIGFFLLGTYLRDNSIMDVGWGLGFIVLALYSFMSYSEQSFRQFVITFLVFLWGFRLSSYIFQRRVGEDWRYAKWRKEWKHPVARSFFQVYLLQGVLMYIVALPILFANSVTGSQIGFLDVFGSIIFLLGFVFEAIADYQLEVFRQSKKSKVNRFLRTGLWKYSRHPNYFGETLIWWGVFLIALAGTNMWWLIISPLTVFYMLRYLSGVPILEKKFSKDPEYRKYMRQTSPFVPWRVRY